MIYKFEKKTLKLITLIFGLTLLLLFLIKYFNARETFYREYIKHKEIMFVLANHKTKTKIEIKEDILKKIITGNGADFKSFAQVTEGYEIKGRNLSGIRIPQLVFSLEDAGIEIVKFKAKDNTGNSIYDFEIILR